MTDQQPPREYIEHVLCDRYKWTLHYVRSLSLSDVLACLTVLGAEAEALKVKHG